jgi:hypothetical protein
MQLFSKPKIPSQPRPAVRDDVIGQMNQADELARRRGGAADIVAGMAGGAPSGGKVTLGS